MVIALQTAEYRMKYVPTLAIKNKYIQRENFKSLKQFPHLYSLYYISVHLNIKPLELTQVYNCVFVCFYTILVQYICTYQHCYSHNNSNFISINIYTHIHKQLAISFLTTCTLCLCSVIHEWWNLLPNSQPRRISCMS